MSSEQRLRVVYTMRVLPRTKERLDRLKKYNADVPWDIILEPIINQVLLPKPQSHSTTLPPIIPVTVNYAP